MHHQTISPLITVGVVIAMMVLRMRGMRRSQRLRLELLWVVPAILLVATAAIFVRTPPAGLGWLWIVLALAAGGGIGWWRGAMMRITIDPNTHLLNQQASPAAMLSLIAIIALRFGARMWLADSAAGPGLAQVTDALMAFALAMFSLQRLEMFLRARRLLGAIPGPKPGSRRQPNIG